MSNSINDNIKLQTGLGGNDGLSLWFNRQPGECLNDAEYRWLSSIDTQNSGTINDKWFNILRSAGYTGTLNDMKSSYWESPITFPSELSNLKLWTRFNSGITVTGSGVSQWDDVSGNGNHLKQGTDANRMTLEADGSILGNGVNQFLKADAFTLVQPETIYLLFKQVSWTSGDYLFDGNAVNTGLVFQTGISPNLTAYTNAEGASTNDLPIGDYGVLAVTFDQANSLHTIQINHNTPATDTAFGIANMGGFTLGSQGNTIGGFSNIQVKEVFVYSVAHDAAQRAKAVTYLSNVGGL